MKKLTADELKQYQLMIMDEVHDFCQKNNIQYYLWAGSLIGAIRHNGYIPWDDDIDIVMFREDYERFITLFNKKEKYFHALSIRTDPGYHSHFSKIVYLKSKLVEGHTKFHDVDVPINIDLFPIDPIPADINKSPWLLRHLHLLDKILYCKSVRKECMKYKPLRQQLLILFYRSFYFWISRDYLAKKQESLAQQFSKEKYREFCSVVTCHYKNKFPVWHTSSFTPIKHSFEKRSYVIPQGYDEVLREHYGDYMQLPPENQRINKHGLLAEGEEL